MQKKIVLDLINDEAPLFIEGVSLLFQQKILQKDFVLGIVDGDRWEQEAKGLSSINRLHFFDDLDTKGINISRELERISKQYDNFNIYACDRYLTQKSRKYQEKILVYTYLFYEEVFSKNVSHYFTTGIAFTYNLISYQVAKKHGVKNISFYGTRIGNRTAISLDTDNTFNEVLEAYDNFESELVKEEMYTPLLDFLNKPEQPVYMTNVINSSSLKFIFIKEFFIRFKKYYFSNKHKYDLFTKSPFVLARFRLNKIITAKKVNIVHNSIFDQVDYRDKYVVFPLHMQPEASTLIMSPFDVNQQNAVINISKLIPPNMKLYVKEHRSALGQHSKKFYKELKKYPNIKLISYRENMFDLIKNSLGTICLSSTAGLESLILKKPSITLGKVFYNNTGLTFNTESYYELKKIIKLVSNPDFNVEDYFENYYERLAFYLHCLKEKSYPFEFNVAKLDTKEIVLDVKNIEAFSKFLIKFLNSENYL